MKHVIAFLFILHFLGINAQVDSLVLVSKHTINTSSISQVSLDAQNNFLILNETHFFKLSPNLDTLHSFFHPQQNEGVVSFQTYPLQSFLFSREAQKVLVLNRFLTKHSDISISDDLFTFMEAACITNDQYLWIVDMESLSLKKYNYQTKNLVFETSLLPIIEDNFNPIQLTFYNNLLFLHYDQGILVFDLFGNFKYNLPIQTSSFSFFQDQIFCITDHHITSYHLFQHHKQTYILPSSSDIQHVIYNGEFFFIFDDNHNILKHKKRS